IAIGRHVEIQIGRYNPQIARFAPSASYGTSYDPVFSFSGEHDYDLSPGGVDAQGRPFASRQSDRDALSRDISGMLPWGLNYRIGGTASDQTTSSHISIFGTNITSFATNVFFDPGT